MLFDPSYLQILYPQNKQEANLLSASINVKNNYRCSTSTYMIKKRRHCNCIHRTFSCIGLQKCQWSHIPQLTKKIKNKQIRQKGNNKLQMVEVKGREGDHPKEREKKKETKDDKEVYFSWLIKRTTDEMRHIIGFWKRCYAFFVTSLLVRLFE